MKKGKYSALTEWLTQCELDTVHLSFSELNRIISLPNHAYKNRPSWANLKKPMSFCSGWINAGYIVSAVDLSAQWVEFSKGQVEGRQVRNLKYNDDSHEKDIPAVLKCGYKCCDEMRLDPNHRYLSWEHCHRAFKQYRQNYNDVTLDLLCLHLAWYLASWGMLRNSFLMQKDYKVHLPVVKLLLDSRWDELWDISPSKLALHQYAEKIVQLCSEIKSAYSEICGGTPTETLLSKILLGTLGCVPAYDRYFKHALSATKAATQQCSAKSLTMLGNLYLKYEEQFESLRKYCSTNDMEYPIAKIIDMCFFEYGLQLEGGVYTED